MPPPPHELAVGDGRYQLDGRLGAGGMAVVYRLTHSTLGTPYALKVIREPSASGQSRLLREGKAQASLRHPNLVSVVDVLEVQGLPALVMEYVDGPALDVVLAQRRLTIDQVDWLARGLLDGMVEAHRQGFIHRDLKPANVLLDVDGAPTPRIADFGLVKQVGTEQDLTHGTRTGAVMGTPAYMAPEQIRDASKVDARADVFALGCVLYELLAGRRPFGGEDSFALFESIVYGRYARLEEVVPGVPERMVRAVEAALQGDRDARVGSVEALRRLWLADAPPLEPAEVWDGDTLAWMRAHRPAVDAVDSTLAASLASAGSRDGDVSPLAQPGADDARITRLGLLGGMVAGAALVVSMAGGREVEWLAPVGAAVALVPMIAAPAWAAHSGVGSPLRLGGFTGAVVGCVAWLVGVGPLNLVSTLRAPRATRIIGEGAPLEALRTGVVDTEGVLGEAAAQVLSMASIEGTTSFWTTVGVAAGIGVVAGLFGGARRQTPVRSAPWHPVVGGWLGVAVQASVFAVLAWSATRLPPHERSLLAMVTALALSAGPVLLAASVLSVASLAADLRTGERARALVAAALLGVLHLGALVAGGVETVPVAVAMRIAVVACVPVWLVGLPWAWVSRDRQGVAVEPLDAGQRWAVIGLVGVAVASVWLGAGGGLRAVAAAFVDAEGFRDPALTVQVGTATMWAAVGRTLALTACVVGGGALAVGSGLAIAGCRGLSWPARMGMVAAPLGLALAGGAALQGEATLERPVLRVRVDHEASLRWPPGATGAQVGDSELAEVRGGPDRPYLRVKGLSEGRTALTFERGSAAPVVVDIAVLGRERSPKHALYVEAGMVALLPQPPAIVSADIGDPEVIQAIVFRRDLIELRANKAGQTTFSIVDESGRSLGWDVIVYPHDSAQEYPSPHVADVDCCRSVRVPLGSETGVSLPARPRDPRMNDTAIARIRFLDQEAPDDGVERPVMAAVQGLALGRTMLVVESQSQVPAIYEIEVYDAGRSVVAGVGYATVLARDEPVIVHPDLAKVMPLDDGLYALVGRQPGLTTLRSRRPDGEVLEEPVMVGLEESPPPHLAEVECCAEVTGVAGESTPVELPVWAQHVHMADETIASIAIGEVAAEGPRVRTSTLRGLRYGKTTAVITGRGQPPYVVNVEITAM